MADNQSQSTEQLNDPFRSVVDDAVDRLEKRWKASSCPDINPLLPLIGDPARHRILVELIKVDQELRWRAGIKKALESYLQDWPELGQSPAIKLELLEAELQTLAAFGTLPSLEGMQRRFPNLAFERLKELLRGAEQKSAASGRHEPETVPHGDSDTGSGRLDVRCPNCHSPLSVAADTQFTDLTCPSCGSHFSIISQGQPTTTAPPLTSLGRFQLLERLGLGSFGTVWKARDKELDRTVAIKIPRQTGMTAEEQERFLREARATAQLRHPSIVSVHEVGRDGDSVFIVSDFVRGVTLSDWLTGQQLTSREAAELCAKIADALQHAHEQGVIHRDLKPANIMIDSNGQPHLMDFGLARRDAGEVTMTLEGHVLGTAAYMSPEQAQGEAHKADARSDVYSLGVILFQLLTGELPFRGNPRMIIHQVIHNDPPSPRKFRSSVPRDLETIALKCMEKTLVRRYQNAREVATELRRYLGGEPIHARPVRMSGRAWRWCMRNRLVAALTFAVITAMVTGTAVSISYALLADRRAREADAAKEKTERLAYQATIQSVWSDIRLGHFQKVESRLRDTMPKYRGWEWGFLIGQCEQPKWIINAGDTEVSILSASPDGNAILTGCGNRLALWGRRNESPFWEVAFSSPNVTDEKCKWSVAERSGSSSFYARGEFVAAIWNGQLLAYRVSDGKQLFQSSALYFTCVAADSNSTRLYAGTSDGQLQVIDTKNWETVQSSSKIGQPIEIIAVGLTGKFIATATKAEEREFGAKHIDVYDAQHLSLIAAFRTKYNHGARALTIIDNVEEPLLLVTESAFTFVYPIATVRDLWESRVLQHPELARPPIAPSNRMRTVDIDSPALKGPEMDMVGFAITSRGDKAVSASRDGILSIYEPPKSITAVSAKTKPIRSIYLGTASFHVTCLAESGFLSGSVDGKVREWLFAASNFSAPIEHIPEHKQGEDGEPTTDQQGALGVQALDTQGARALDFSSDGRTLAIGGWWVADDILLHDTQTQSTRRVHVAGAGGRPGLVRFRPNCSELVVQAGKSFQFLDTLKTDSPAIRVLHYSSTPCDLDFDKVGRIMAVSFEDGLIQVDQLFDLDKPPIRLQGRLKKACRIALSSDGELLAAHSPGSRGCVELWNLRTKQIRRVIETRPSIGLARRDVAMMPDRDDGAVAIHPNGKIVATADDGGRIRIWNTETGNLINLLEGHGYVGVASLQFSQDGERLLSGSNDRTVRLWDWKLGGELLVFRQGMYASCARFGPDGMVIANTDYYPMGAWIRRALPWKDPDKNRGVGD